jgi:3,4-dihydroxy 2-butanone 4-phosphate synthase/GTP cyclohydrolase II
MMVEKQLDSVEDAIAAIADGDLVVVVDDEDRENEGDLIMAANKASPEQVGFMIRHTSGILCVPVERDLARSLQLDPMVHANDAPLQTAFTVSVDYRHGLTTGISAEERCNTILGLANSNTSAADFVRPGHIFPLIAREGGVLVRSGHTEAGVDLARLAGCSPIGLLAEVVNDDGSVQRLPQLLEFAAEHDLKIISIADLIAYRQTRENLVERMEEFEVMTSVGAAHAVTYRTRFDQTEHLALVFGKPVPGSPILVRIHRERLLDDVFGSQSGHQSNLVATCLQRISEETSGIFLYLRSGNGHSIDLQDVGPLDSSQVSHTEQWKEIGVGAQILKDLGADTIRLLAGRQHNYVGMSGFGITLASTEPLD